MNHNYFERKLYLCLLNDKDEKNRFAQSFLSAEWYYKSLLTTRGLEQTAIIVGYLKSVEQLLYFIIDSIGEGRNIKRKKYIEENDPKVYKGKQSVKRLT